MALKTSKGPWQKLRAWAQAQGASHNSVACACIALAMAASLIGLFAFVAFSDFGSSATFIYNQF